MQQKNNPNLGKIGMKRNTAPHLLQEGEYVFMLNGNNENVIGDRLNNMNEPSNLLCLNYPVDYKVIGYKNDINSDKTYYFLTNPETGYSKFGYISNIQNIQSVEDVEVECSECDYRNILSEALENKTQIASCTFIELLEDSCNKGFNFNINFPIKKIEIKSEKCGKSLYFTDNYNPPRYIRLDNIDRYLYEGEEVCSVDNTTPTCLAAEKLRMFPLRTTLEITPNSIVLGGNLKLGAYEFLVAYCDNLGNELTEYTSITNPIHIFDENNTILEQQNIADRTNFAIKLDVAKLDNTFQYYKVVVIQTADIQRATRYFEEGVHPISDTTVLYTTEEGKKEISIDDLFFVKPNITKAEGLSQANNILFLNGLTAEKEWNLQPVMNLLGSFLRWQTHITTEEYYKQGMAEKGYHRDEVQPFGIRFGTTTGYETALFPFIGRPATTDELTDVADNKDSQSILAINNNCSTSERTKKWQFYNTAEELGECSSIDIPTNIIEEQVSKVCTIENVATATADTITIFDVDEFVSLEDFINGIIEEGTCIGYPFCSFIEPIPTDNCDPQFDNCDIPSSPEREYLEVNTISGADVTENYITFPTEYSNIKTTGSCQVFELDQNGNTIGDEEFDEDYLEDPGGIDTFALIRNLIYGNDSPYTTDKLRPITDLSQTISGGYIINYKGSYVQDDLRYTNFITTCTKTENLSISIPGSGNNITWSGTEFTDRVHRNSIWFEVEFEDIRTNPEGFKNFIFEATKGLPDRAGKKDSLSSNSLRISVFDNKAGGTNKYCDFFTTDDGIQFFISFLENPDPETAGSLVVGREYRITTVGTTDFTLIGASTNTVGEIFTATGAGTGTGTATSTEGILTFQDEDENPIEVSSTSSNKLYFVVDAAIYEGTVDIEGIPTTSYIGFGTGECMAVGIKPEEIESLTISYDSITFDKIQKWTTNCQFEIPIVNECEAQPYKYGKFSYLESAENYPDNKELYDSSSLNIEVSDIPSEYQVEFQEYFVDSIVDGKYVLGDQTNQTCKPIKHFKFPDNKIAPFMWENQQAPFTPSLIFPLGITIDENLINSFLDIAVKNNLITQEERDTIVYYEIFKGDRSLDKTIIGKGLLYDMYEYEEEGRKIQYSNYPYNDLGEDVLHYDDSRTNLIQHPYSGDSNINWTFHAPETDYLKPTLPTEMKIEGYMYGSSRGHFDEVEDHSKWVILGREAYRLASTLATAEVIAEAAITIAESAEVWRFQVGVANSANPVGIALNVAVAATQVISSLAYKYGRYKYQWLESFRNLGQPQNFAYFYSSEGYYNYFQTHQTEGEYLRGLTLTKYLKEGKFYLTNEVEGKKVEVNNINRERSVYLGISSDTPLAYPTEYKNYDNSETDGSASSRTYLSRTNVCSPGRSVELIKNIASPYVAIKNYNPSQFGTIDSVKWLSTSYRGDLTNPSSDCRPIFGGDVVISRHTLKRKFPMFLTDASDIPSLTPFNYKFYSTIGTEPRFFCNYEVTDDLNLDRGFPELKSEYNFDCLEGDRDFYVKEPSKFYLYYYGIPSFLCETEINTNYRYGKKEPQNNFYPNVGDFVDWTQEKNVSIREPNTFFYNFTYSKLISKNIHRTLPFTYSAEEYDCRYDAPNGVMYSLPDNSENDLVDPWLIFKPLDRYEFSTSYGKLIDLVGVENEQIMARFENQKVLFNAFDTLVDDGQNPQTSNLGSGGIFARRPVTFSKSDLGVLGTQHTDYALTPYGLFDVDAKRGKIYQYSSKNMDEISSFIQGKPSGMRNWFREHLPFKILKTYPDLDIDNKFKSIGISIGWDARFDRVFFTKKDYIGLDNTLCIDSEGVPHKTQGIEVDAIIANYEAQGYTNEGIENCKLKFTKENSNISESTDVHVFYDNSGSMTAEQLASTEIAVQSWHSSLSSLLPGYSGQLYEYVGNTGQENWLGQLQRIVDETIINGYEGDISGKDIVIISLINEASPLYHASINVLGSFITMNSIISTPQMLDKYYEDYCNFSGLLPTLSSFKGVQYTILNRGGVKALIIQTLAALYGRPLTTQEFENLPKNPVFLDDEWNVEGRRILTTETNPYADNFIPCNNLVEYEGIKDMGYLTQIDRSSANQKGYLTIESIGVNKALYIGLPGMPLQAYLMVFNTDVPTTLSDFVTTHSAMVLSNTGSTITSNGNTLEFSLMQPGNTEYPMVDYSTDVIVSDPPLVSEQEFSDDINELLNIGGGDSEIETIYVDLPEVEFTDTQYFKDVSWTVSYKPVDGQWVSYYSFKPDFYVNHYNYFQTGLNYSMDDSEIGIWSHLLTNKSFCVFYGKKYPFILEVPYKNEYQNKLFQEILFQTESKRFHNEYDYVIDRSITFNKVVLYNHTNNSGQLNLIPQKHNFVDNNKYPKTNTNNTQDIIISTQDEDWHLNYFYNRVKNDRNNINHWIKDDNDINKYINNQAISFTGKSFLDRFRGDWAIARFEYDRDSRYQVMYKISTAKEQVY